MNTVMIARKCDIVDEEGKVTSGILLMEISESLLDQMLGEMVGRPNIWDDPWWKTKPMGDSSNRWFFANELMAQ